MNLYFRPGFLWNCPWRLLWGEGHEYWDLYQLGPFYILHLQTREYDEYADDEPEAQPK